MGLLDRFLRDTHAMRYKDVLKTNVALRALNDLVTFFDSGDIVRRMIESELHHDRPPLAGVVKDLESLITKQINAALEVGDLAEGPTAMRRNQMIGVIVRLVMESKGWASTGKKGSLAGLSTMFTRGERYAPIKGEK
jgi:hypothetical protein